MSEKFNWRVAMDEIPWTVSGIPYSWPRLTFDDGNANVVKGLYLLDPITFKQVPLADNHFKCRVIFSRLSKLHAAVVALYDLS
ncbi:MAG: hypothetical protein KJO19_08360 [Woeseia sp.]|nr:hypothetical protein [Woeseia sp.]